MNLKYFSLSTKAYFHWWNFLVKWNNLDKFLEMLYQANHTTGNNKLSEQDDIKEN